MSRVGSGAWKPQGGGKWKIVGGIGVATDIDDDVGQGR